MSNLLIEIGIGDFPIHYFGIAKRIVEEELTKEFFFSGFQFNSITVDSRKQRFIGRIEHITHDEYDKIQLKIEISHTVQLALQKVCLPIFNEEIENSGNLVSYIEWIQLLLDGELVNATDDFFLSLGKPSDMEFTESIIHKDFILDSEECIEKVKLKIRRLAREKALEAKISNYIIEKYINKYESVYPFIANFDSAFLSLHEKIIETVLNEDFNFLTVYREGAVSEYFIGFLDTEHPDAIHDLVNIVNTRFTDIKQKFSNTVDHSIQYYVDELKGLSYMKNLGNYYDRTLRIVDISAQLATLLNVGDTTIENVKQIAYLSKADHQTDLVKEFPTLYGTIGMIQAESSGYNSIVSNGIFECKKPRFEYDDIPESTAGRIVSITNRFEYIISYYLSNGMNYRSLFQLQSKVLGIINIILASKWTLDIREVLKSSIYAFLKNDIAIDYNKVSEDVIKYIRIVLRDELIRYKYKFFIIDSIMGKDLYDMYDIYKRVQSVSEILESTNYDILSLSKNINAYCIAHADQISSLNMNEDERNVTFHKLYLQSQYRTILKELWLLNDTLNEYMSNSYQMENFQLIYICNKAFHSIFDIEEVYLCKE